jgi:hypothetical protein
MQKCHQILAYLLREKQYFIKPIFWHSLTKIFLIKYLREKACCESIPLGLTIIFCFNFFAKYSGMIEKKRENMPFIRINHIAVVL